MLCESRRRASPWNLWRALSQAKTHQENPVRSVQDLTTDSGQSLAGPVRLQSGRNAQGLPRSLHRTSSRNRGIAPLCLLSRCSIPPHAPGPVRSPANGPALFPEAAAVSLGALDSLLGTRYQNYIADGRQLEAFLTEKSLWLKAGHYEPSHESARGSNGPWLKLAARLKSCPDENQSCHTDSLLLVLNLLHLCSAHSQEWLCHQPFSAKCETATHKNQL
jgi:hypothetical protein